MLRSVPRPAEVISPFSVTVLAVCALALIGGFILYAKPSLLWARHLMRVASARRWGAILLWIGSLGFFFFIVGWLQINPFTFGERIWMLLMLIVALIAFALLLLQMRAESAILSRERQTYQEAIARGIHTRRPPRRSARRKR